MITILLEQIIELIKGWISAFSNHAQHVEDKLDSIDSTASDIKDNTDSLPDIEDNTAAVITPINNIKTNTDSIASSNTTIANNTTAISNQVSAMSTNVGRAAAYAEDCANNSLNILDKVTTIASDTTQIRTDTGNMSLEQSKIYDALKWLLADKTTTEDLSGTGVLSFETDMTEELNNCILTFNSDSGFSSAEVFRTGKNLFDKTATDTNKGFVSGYYLLSNGNENQGFAWNISEYIKVKASTNYTIQGVSGNSPSVCYYDKDKAYISGENYNGNTSITISTPNNCAYIRLSYNTANIDGVQLEQGSTATAFSAYQGTSVVIPFGDTYYSGVIDVLNGIGVVADTPNTTPSISISFTPGVINTLKGLNNIFADTESDLDITYTESVKFYLDKQDNA